MNLEQYPFRPSHKGRSETGLVAARRVTSKAKAHRDQIEAWFREGHQGSGEGVGRALGIPKTSARSRCSELAGQGILVDSGERDRNTASGLAAVVWKLQERT